MRRVPTHAFRLVINDMRRESEAVVAAALKAQRQTHQAAKIARLLSEARAKAAKESTQ